MVAKDTFLDLQNEHGGLIEEFKAMKAFKENSEQQQVDLFYEFKKHSHDLQGGMHNIETLEQDLE